MASSATSDDCAGSAVAVALVGDSDISRWPADLVPTCCTATSNNINNGKNDDGESTIIPPPSVTTKTRTTSVPTTSIRGQSGATIEEVIPLLELELEEKSKNNNIQTLHVIFCAGENDIGQNIRLDESLISFRKFLDTMFPTPVPVPSSSTTGNNITFMKKHLIVLGPKFEPWLEYDAACRKQYFKLSNAMERACNKHPVMMKEGGGENNNNNNNKITFIDCLTMFCEKSSAEQPGAVLGGKAIPEKKFFDHDLLHLSREGYQIWKKVTEQCIMNGGYSSSSPRIVQ